MFHIVHHLLSQSCTTVGHLLFWKSPHVQLVGGKIVTAMVAEDYITIIYNIVLPGSLKPLWCLNWRVIGWVRRWTQKAGLAFFFASPCLFSSPRSPLSLALQPMLSSALGAGAGLGDSPWAVGGGPAHHLLAPLAVAGLLQAPAGRFNWQRTGGDGGEEAAAAVHGESQVHRWLQHHLQDEVQWQINDHRFLVLWCI